MNLTRIFERKPNGDRLITMSIGTVLDKAAERARDADPRRR